MAGWLASPAVAPIMPRGQEPGARFADLAGTGHGYSRFTAIVYLDFVDLRRHDVPVTTIYYEHDADLGVLSENTLAVVGYGNQGRSWALNLRDSGLQPVVCVRRDATREQAIEDGFDVREIADADQADVICLLVPDDVVPLLALRPTPASCVVVASGYTFAFGRLVPPGDAGLVAPRMLGPEVRRCYEENVGFITAVGVHQDVSGRALDRVLAVAKAIGGLKQGAIELTAQQEALLDLGVEQLLSPALTAVNSAFVQTMMERGIPLEAIITELVLSGEVERTYRLLRQVGYAAQSEFHSPTSQYGQLTRRGRFDHLDFLTTMRALADDIDSGRFADEWDAERDSGYPILTRLKEQHAGPAVREFEADLRSRLGPGAASR
jgi:ketol-acid reductoisomerase